MNLSRQDLRDARCTECGARCIPGQTHLEHNLGWKKRVFTSDFIEIALKGFPGWDLVDAGTGRKPEPPSVALAIRSGGDKSSLEICREFDDVAVGRFHEKNLPRDGSVFVREGEVYDAKWYFEKRTDAYVFARRYGGRA
jgi:hypothetical protein